MIKAAQFIVMIAVGFILGFCVGSPSTEDRYKLWSDGVDYGISQKCLKNECEGQ